MSLQEEIMDIVLDDNASNMTVPLEKSGQATSVSFTNYLLCGPLLTIFIIIGILGNSACLCIFLKRRPTAGKPASRLRQPVYVYLLSLAAWDVILLCASFMLYNLHILIGDGLMNDPVYLHSLPYFYYATNTAHYCANWVVVALGLERYIALCHPFKHRLFIDGRRRAIYVVCSISVAGILYTLPRLFEASVYYKADDGETEISYSTLQQSAIYQTIYRVIGGMCLYSVGPFLCLLYVSIRVSAAVRQQRLFQATTQSMRIGRRDGIIVTASTARQVRVAGRTDTNDSTYGINVMLIAIMVKLLFVHSLPTALDVAEATMGDKAFSSKVMDYLADTSILLVVVNSSCNFFVYFVCSRKFRDEFKRLLCKRKWAARLCSRTRTCEVKNDNCSDPPRHKESSPFLNRQWSNDYVRQASHIEAKISASDYSRKVSTSSTDV